MDSTQKRRLVVDPILSKVPEIGRWLWALQDTRQLTLEEIEQLTPAMIDWLPPDDESTIGTILYHIALIEMDWLYAEVLERPEAPEIAELFAYEHRDRQGRLTQVTGISLQEHLIRLEVVRALLLESYLQMDLAEFRRPRSLPAYDVTPEWVLHHLIQHEAEHRSQLGSLRLQATRSLALERE